MSITVMIVEVIPSTSSFDANEWSEDGIPATMRRFFLPQHLASFLEECFGGMSAIADMSYAFEQYKEITPADYDEQFFPGAYEEGFKALERCRDLYLVGAYYTVFIG